MHDHRCPAPDPQTFTALTPRRFRLPLYPMRLFLILLCLVSFAAHAQLIPDTLDRPARSFADIDTMRTLNEYGGKKIQPPGFYCPICKDTIRGPYGGTHRLNYTPWNQMVYPETTNRVILFYKPDRTVQYTVIQVGFFRRKVSIPTILLYEPIW